MKKILKRFKRLMILGYFLSIQIAECSCFTKMLLSEAIYLVCAQSLQVTANFDSFTAPKIFFIKTCSNRNGRKFWKNFFNFVDWI
jgi:hypothetical protein